MYDGMSRRESGRILTVALQAGYPERANLIDLGAEHLSGE